MVQQNSPNVNSTIRDWARRRAFERVMAFSCRTHGTTHTAAEERAQHILQLLSKNLVPDVLPYQIQLNLTEQCVRKRHPTGDCAYCSFPEATNVEIDAEELIVNLRTFAEYGGRSVFLSGGGEPGEYSELVVLLDFLATDQLGSKLCLTLNTNGEFAHTLERLSKSPAELDQAWPDKLRAIFRKESNDADPVSIISVSWHDNQQGASAVRRLSQIRDRLGLHFIIRVSSLILFNSANDCDNSCEASSHDRKKSITMIGTNELTINNVINLSRIAGADVICFKPAHYNNDGVRYPIENQGAYEYIQKQMYIQESIAQRHHWNWDVCQTLSEFSIIFDYSPRLNRTKTAYQSSIPFLRAMKVFCIAPFCTVFLAPKGVAICCDCWSTGVGSRVVILANQLVQPVSYFKQIYKSMIEQFSEIWPNNCVMGCGWTELNLTNEFSHKALSNHIEMSL